MYTIRKAFLSDAPAVARLHADSWRAHYRGAFSDVYLDTLADHERLIVWTERLQNATFRKQTFLLFSEQQLAGFICMQVGVDEQFGTLLDNLHVAVDFMGQGYGKILMQRGAAFAQEMAPTVGIHLYVLAQNTAAIGIYERYGGRKQEKVTHLSPSGLEVAAYRYVWDSPVTLLEAIGT